MLHYVLAFITGFFVKWVDWIEDDEGGKSKLKFPLAILYGLLIGYLISVAPFSELFLGAVIAQVFAKKIDTLAHSIGFLTGIVAISFFGFPSISLAFLFYFLILAMLDEVEELREKFAITHKHRPILEIGSLFMLIFGRWEYPLAIILFDAGYLFFIKLKERKKI